MHFGSCHHTAQCSLMPVDKTLKIDRKVIQTCDTYAMSLATVHGLKGVLFHLENHYNTINNVTKILLMLLKLSQAAKKYFQAKKFDI